MGGEGRTAIRRKQEIAEKNRKQKAKRDQEAREKETQRLADDHAQKR